MFKANCWERVSLVDIFPAVVYKISVVCSLFSPGDCFLLCSPINTSTLSPVAVLCSAHPCVVNPCQIQQYFGASDSTRCQKLQSSQCLLFTLEHFTSLCQEFGTCHFSVPCVGILWTCDNVVDWKCERWILNCSQLAIYSLRHSAPRQWSCNWICSSCVPSYSKI